MDKHYIVFGSPERMAHGRISSTPGQDFRGFGLGNIVQPFNIIVPSSTSSPYEIQEKMTPFVDKVEPKAPLKSAESIIGHGPHGEVEKSDKDQSKKEIQASQPEQNEGVEPLRDKEESDKHKESEAEESTSTSSSEDSPFTRADLEESLSNPIKVKEYSLKRPPISNEASPPINKKTFKHKFHLID